MKISKAIEVLTLLSPSNRILSDDDQLDAIKLGIEALEAIQKMRNYPFPDEILQLPGEDPK
ncbi:hypothetical protein ES708_32132 [subsurface metagenome]